jgi:spore maturation protein SpmB
MIFCIVTHSAGAAEALAGLVQARGVAGHKVTMQKIMQELASAHRHVSPYHIARVYGAIDDKQS